MPRDALNKYLKSPAFVSGFGAECSLIQTILRNRTMVNRAVPSLMMGSDSGSGLLGFIVISPLRAW